MTSFANTDDDPSTFLSRFLDSHGGYAAVDGGLATELQLHGADLNDPLCSAICLLTSPDLLRRVHLDYLEAGASIIICDSYQATIEGFEAKGLSRTEGEILLRKSVEIAREARDIYNERCIDTNSSIRRPILVAASIGSYAAYLADGSEYSGDFGEGITVETLKDFHRRRLQVLAESGPDLIAFETIPNKLEAQAYSELIEEEGLKLPVWFTFSCKDSENVVNGDPISDCASIADSCKNVAAVGVNCTPPKFVKGLILSIKKVTNKPIVVYPYTLNSGEKYDALTKQWWPKSSGITDEEFVSYVGEWLDSGATLVGGCCLTTPDTIRAIVKILPTKFVQPEAGERKQIIAVDLEETFGMFDINGVDGITVEELETVIRSLGQNPTAEEIRRMICENTDVADGTAPLEFAEFLNLISRKSKEKDTEEELKEAFKVFDKDQNGFISPSELRHVMINLGEKLTDEEAEQMIKEADSDGDGVVNFDDFVKFMTSL